MSIEIGRRDKINLRIRIEEKMSREIKEKMMKSYVGHPSSESLNYYCIFHRAICEGESNL